MADGADERTVTGDRSRIGWDGRVVKVKSVERTARVQKEQVITYLKLTGMPLGLLVYFGEKLTREGVERLANAEA